MTQDWLKNLKAGDKVFMVGTLTRDLTIVQRITPTGRIVVNNMQFINGVNHSNRWLYLEEATDEEVKKYKAIQFTRAVKFAMGSAKLTYAQAKEINEKQYYNLIEMEIRLSTFLQPVRSLEYVEEQCKKIVDQLEEENETI